jgi:hypothetical protein
VRSPFLLFRWRRWRAFIMKQTKAGLEILSFSVWNKSVQVSIENREFFFPFHRNAIQEESALTYLESSLGPSSSRYNIQARPSYSSTCAKRLIGLTYHHIPVGASDSDCLQVLSPDVYHSQHPRTPSARLYSAHLDR